MIISTPFEAHRDIHESSTRDIKGLEERTLDEICAAEVVEIRIDDYGFTGEGFVRVADGWMSVPGALPGELVRVRVNSKIGRGRRVFAEIQEVIEPSDLRRDPLCARDEVCRGCQLRQVTIDEEMRFHVRTVQEVLEKFAEIPADAQPEVEIISPQPISRGDSFRVRSSLSYRRVPGAEDHGAAGFELGLRSPVQDALVPMFDCPALTTPMRRLVSTVDNVFASLDVLPWDEKMAREAGSEHTSHPAIRSVKVASPVVGRGRVEVCLCESENDDIVEHAVAEGALEQLFERLGDALADEVGLAVSTANRRVILKEPERLVIPLAGLRLEVGYDDWFPATLAPSEALYARVFDLLALQQDEAFLDIGSGIGTIALLAAAKTREVIGLDINRDSVANAELNALGNPLAANAAGKRSPVDFIVGGWENALRNLTLDGRKFDAATINPMREPLGRRALSYLTMLGIRRLVYLGPSPASAARDIAELREMGWKLDTLGAANIHPATYHTMLVAKLTHAADTPE